MIIILVIILLVTVKSLSRVAAWERSAMPLSMLYARDRLCVSAWERSAILLRHFCENPDPDWNSAILKFGCPEILKFGYPAARLSWPRLEAVKTSRVTPTVHRVLHQRFIEFLLSEGWLGRSVDLLRSMLYCWLRWLDLCKAAACERANITGDPTRSLHYCYHYY